MRPRRIIGILPLVLLLIAIGCSKEPASPSSTTVSAATPSSPTIGYVGASLTLGAVDGYETLGGTSFWPALDAKGSYPGGSVYAWYQNLVDASAPNNRWMTFEALLVKYGSTAKIWWHLCPRASTTDAIPTYDQTLAVLNKIKQETDAEIYATVAPKMPYTADTSDYDALNGYVTTMIGQGLVKMGPALTPLTESQLGTDGHPNEEGKAVWGKDLRDFFDAGN